MNKRLPEQIEKRMNALLLEVDESIVNDIRSAIEAEIEKSAKVVHAALTFFVEREKGDICDCLTEHYGKLQDALGEYLGEESK